MIRAVPVMEVGPPGSPCRRRSQTAAVSCRSRAGVGSDCGKGPPRAGQVCDEKTNVSEPLSEASKAETMVPKAGSRIVPVTKARRLGAWSSLHQDRQASSRVAHDTGCRCASGARSARARTAAAAGRDLEESGLVFAIDPFGERPRRPDMVIGRWTRLRKEIGLSHVRRHNLRHFVATELLTAGPGQQPIEAWPGFPSHPWVGGLRRCQA